MVQRTQTQRLEMIAKKLKVRFEFAKKKKEREKEN